MSCPWQCTCIAHHVLPPTCQAGVSRRSGPRLYFQAILTFAGIHRQLTHVSSLQLCIYLHDERFLWRDPGSMADHLLSVYWPSNLFHVQGTGALCLY